MIDELDDDEIAEERHDDLMSVLGKIAQRDNSDILKGLSENAKAIGQLKFTTDLSKVESALNENNKIQSEILKEMKKTIEIKFSRNKLGFLEGCQISRK